MGAIYTGPVVLDSELLTKSLKYCIDVHPVLSAGIRGADTEAPEFVRSPTINVQDHFDYLDSFPQPDSSEVIQSDAYKRVLRHLFARRPLDIEVQPPWRVAVLPLQSTTDASTQRKIVGFGFSHSHGDGASGLAFHRTLAKALNAVTDGSCTYTAVSQHATCTTPLPLPLERAGTLSISWPFLLGPLLAEYTPAPLARWLGLDATTKPGIWRARPAFYDPETSATSVEIVQVPQHLLHRVLAACHANQTTLTGLLHPLIVRALSEALPSDTPALAFVAQTAIDLRRHLTSVSRDDMGVFASGASAVLPRQSAADCSSVWAEAQEMSQLLAKSAGSLHDQSVGLLSYLSKFRPWLAGKIGKPRGGSYEVSNIMVFDDELLEAATWRVGDVFFSQPFDAIDCPLSFNLVSRKGGALILTLSWQVGALEVDDETKFGQDVCRVIGQLLEQAASM